MPAYYVPEDEDVPFHETLAGFVRAAEKRGEEIVQYSAPTRTLFTRKVKRQTRPAKARETR